MCGGSCITSFSDLVIMSEGVGQPFFLDSAANEKFLGQTSLVKKGPILRSHSPSE